MRPELRAPGNTHPHGEIGLNVKDPVKVQGTRGCPQFYFSNLNGVELHTDRDGSGNTDFVTVENSEVAMLGRALRFTITSPRLKLADTLVSTVLAQIHTLYFLSMLHAYPLLELMLQIKVF